MKKYPPLIITGTDTDAGKTWASLAFMLRLQQQGVQVLGMKPIASGCEQTAQGLRNADALLLQRYGSVLVDYDDINPYAFIAPIAPHFAAAQAGQVIDLAVIQQHVQYLQQQTQQVLIEGIGGWAVPFNSHHSLQHLALALDAGVILVVGLRLGCINHALLTVAALLSSGVRFVGWIANQVTADFAAADSIAYLREQINLPYLGYLPHCRGELSTAVLRDFSQQLEW